jgi:hypothetical protein
MTLNKNKLIICGGIEHSSETRTCRTLSNPTNINSVCKSDDMHALNMSSSYLSLLTVDGSVFVLGGRSVWEYVEDTKVWMHRADLEHGVSSFGATVIPV